MTKKIVKRTDANNETLYFYTHSDAVDVGEGSSMKSLTEVIDDTLHKSAQTLTNAEKTQALTNLGLNGVDDVPTENSNNVVRSGGVKAAIDDVIDDFTNRGFMYKGIAPVSAPLGEDKTFYIAKSGDYSAYTGIGNDGSFTLNGIAVLTYATASASGAWTKNDIVLFDEEPTANSNNLVKSGGVFKEIYNFSEIDLESIPNRSYAITAQGVWGVDSGYKHKLVKVNAGEKYRIVPNVENYAIYSFLKSDSSPVAGEIPDICADTSARYTATTETIVVIPNDCAYLYIYVGNPGVGTNFLPTLFLVTSYKDVAGDIFFIKEQYLTDEQCSQVRKNMGYDDGSIAEEAEETNRIILAKGVNKLKKQLYSSESYTTVPVDIDGGLRNVNSETGEFVETSSRNHYANEITLSGREISISVNPSWSFNSNYGYAFLKEDNTFVSGAKTTTAAGIIIYPANAVKAGATKLRVSVKSNSVITIHKFEEGDVTVLKEKVAEMEKTIGNVIGSPNTYLPNNLDVTGLSLFSSLSEIYDAWDSLASQYPLWLKKETDIGMDESGTYSMRYYTLRMQNPLITNDRAGNNTNQWDDVAYPMRRLLIVMSVHSDEKYASLGGYLAIKELLENNEEWAIFIRSNFILDIIPCANPWGVENGFVRTNSGGKDLNRCYFSDIQAENQNIIDLVQELKPKGLIGIIDCHNTTTGDGYLVEKPAYKYWNYYAVLAQQLQGVIRPITTEIFGDTIRQNHFHLWDASAYSGQLHQYADSQDLLGCTFEVSRSMSSAAGKLKGSLMTKTLLINLINAFGCK